MIALSAMPISWVRTVIGLCSPGRSRVRYVCIWRLQALIAQVNVSQAYVDGRYGYGLISYV